MKSKVYLIAGVPASGKTWVVNQLKQSFKVIPHDDFIEKDYVAELKESAAQSRKPIVAETPFSVSNIKTPLEASGVPVEVVYIHDNPSILATRYLAREGKAYSKGDVTRNNTYLRRAHESNSFVGTSSEVLEYLKGKV